MTICVFVGPTLPVEDGRRILDAEFLPPVSQGDVYRVARDRPWGIGIIDGYFERMPSVWHKEILWAMREGVHVFGAASMGALRAAELAAFGMEGVGAIFEEFRRGELTDDDEVTVYHGPEEAGYLALSEAMVDIRATLRAAEDEAGVLRRETRRALEAVAKSLYYGERTYPRIFEIASRQGLAADELAALRSWLPEGRVDQKRADAIAMLRAMKARRKEQPGPLSVRYRFNRTETFDQMCRNSERRRSWLERPEESLELILDELRLCGEDVYLPVLERALARALAIAASNWHGVEVTPELVEQTARDFRLERRLESPEELRGWMAAQDLDLDGFTDLMRREARVAWIERLYQASAYDHVADHLRLLGRMDGVRERAAEKARRLGAAGHANPGVADTGLERDELLEWHFAKELGREVPVDLERYARGLGFESAGGFLQLVAREYLYRQLSRES